jgi:hypothetical protein
LISTGRRANKPIAKRPRPLCKSKLPNPSAFPKEANSTPAFARIIAFGTNPIKDPKKKVGYPIPTVPEDMLMSQFGNIGVTLRNTKKKNMFPSFSVIVDLIRSRPCEK